MQDASERVERSMPILELPEVKEQVERVRGHLQALDTQVRRVVQDRPLVAVGVALIFGYALGRLLARR
ncbi:MAG TPA: hypothetical protein VMS55_11315 [Myxococcota bacterium]|nr:hypothetical protein [Myxococcota bacterium]